MSAPVQPRQDGLLQLQHVCVYCGSSDKVRPVYLDAARQLGRVLASQHLTLVFGGGSTGLMGPLADAVLQAGGAAIGVIPEVFHTPQLAHQGLTELHITPDMHARKSLMMRLADAFIALPGGLGTFEELFETLTWAQVGLLARPIGLLNVNHYFDHLLSLIKSAQGEGFLYQEHSGLLLVEEDPQALLERLRGYRPPQGPNPWVTREEKAR
jgi:uncharacterized protein (TIGR00730 family)